MTGCEGACALYLLHFSEVRVVIYNHNKVVSIEREQISGYFALGTLRDSCTMRGSQACDGCTALHNMEVTHIIFYL